MAPVTLLELGILIAFLAPAFPTGASRRRRRKALVRRLGAMPYDRNVGSRGQAILALMVVGFAVCGELGVSPAVVAALGAGAAFLLGGVSRKAMVRRMCLDDVAFFACLFVMVGAVGGFNVHGTDEAVWWALSLGVCAGSSATLTGATAGPVAASLLEEHGVPLTFNRFARTGVPVMFAFLIVSSCYLALVVR